MANITSKTADAQVELPTEDYPKQLKFNELLRDVVDSIHSNTSEDALITRVELLASGIGRNLLKLRDLVRIIHTKIEAHSGWDRTVAVTFCGVLFDMIDENIELQVVENHKVFGAQVVAKYMVDAAGAFVVHPDWGHAPVAVMDLIVSLVGAACSPAAQDLACGMLEKMAQSCYIFFYDNWSLFAPFAHDVGRTVDSADGSRKSARIDRILETVQNQDYERDDLQELLIKRLYDFLGRSDLYHTHAARKDDRIPSDHFSSALIPFHELEKEVAKNLDLFATNFEWNNPAAKRWIKSVARRVEKNAPMFVQTAAFSTIDAMVQSGNLFFHKNLDLFTQFVFSVAPVLDSTAGTDQHNRLTALLDRLSSHACGKTPDQIRAIKILRRKLRRAEDVEVRLPCGVGGNERA